MLPKKLRFNFNFLPVFLAALIVYLPSFFFKLTFFDDQVAVIANHSFWSKWQNIFVLFQRDTFNVFSLQTPGYYRPLGALTMFWDAHLGGINPFSYHVTNFLFHVAASWALYLVLQRLVKANQRINLFLALVFTLHPLLVPAVAWIPGRGESMLALFVLLSFYFFLADSWRAHLFFLLCALFTKESALVFPFVLALYAVLYKRRGLLYYCAGWFACALLFISAKLAAVGTLASGMGLKDILYSCLRNWAGIIIYLGKIFLPLRLSVLPVLSGIDLAIGFGVLLFLGLGLGRLAFSRRKEKPDFKIIIFGICWYLVFLIPSFIYPDPKQFPGFLEQRVYLSLCGLIWGIAQVMGYFYPGLARRAFLKPAALILLLLLGLMTLVRSFDYSGRMVFWQKAVNGAPNSALAHRNLGAMLYLDGKIKLAQAQFLKSLEINPSEPMVHNNLGLILMNRGQLAAAREEYLKELAVNPDYDDVNFNFGLLKYSLQDRAGAKELWEKTVSLNPGYRDAWEGLIRLAVESGKPAQAALYLEKSRQAGLNL